jgi:hypothetical protein
LARAEAIERGDLPNGKRQLQVWIPAPLFERLKAACALNHRPMAWYIERAAQAALRQYPITLPDE